MSETRFGVNSLTVGSRLCPIIFHFHWNYTSGTIPHRNAFSRPTILACLLLHRPTSDRLLWLDSLCFLTETKRLLSFFFVVLCSWFVDNSKPKQYSAPSIKIRRSFESNRIQHYIRSGSTCAKIPVANSIFCSRSDSDGQELLLHFVKLNPFISTSSLCCYGSIRKEAAVEQAE